MHQRKSSGRKSTIKQKGKQKTDYMVLDMYMSSESYKETKIGAHVNKTTYLPDQKTQLYMIRVLASLDLKNVVYLSSL